MDLVRIKGLELDCIVGVRPHEREREQRVHIDLALGLDLRPAGQSGRIGLTCDYDRVAEEIIAMLRFRRYHLIEMATEELAAMLMGLHDGVKTVEIHLDKPAALDGRARAASVEVHRQRSDFPTRRARRGSHELEVLLETREAGLYLVRLGPREPLERGLFEGRRELSWVVGEPTTDPESPAFRIREPGGALGHHDGGADGLLGFHCVVPPLGVIRE
jgi:FolB domain-containing protein